MSSHNNTRAQSRRRRHKAGVPVMLVIVLLILALLMGGLAGFFIARRTDLHVHELQAANERITELENTLTLIGYPVGDDVDPQQWLYDNTAGDSALDDLSGASWGEVDEDDPWQEESLLDGTLPEDSDPVVVAEFDGGQLLSTEVIPAYNDRLTSRIFNGESADAVAAETLSAVMAELVADKIIAARAKEQGLTELTAEDLAEIDRQARENYDKLLDDYAAFALSEGGDRDAAAKQLEQESGVTLASITESLKQSWWQRKFYDETVKDVTVSDEEVRAHYDALLSRQHKAFDPSPEAFEEAHESGEAIVYHPKGYRAVRDILIPFSQADAEAAASLAGKLELDSADEEAQRQLDALYAPLEEKARKAQEALAGGASFGSLMDQYGCSPALKNEPMRSEGYYLNSQSYVNSSEYVEGSMMLEEPGQVSAPLRSASGVHLVEYIADVAPGEIPLEQAEDAVRADALEQKQAEYFEQQRQALLDAANVKYYPERLQ